MGFLMTGDTSPTNITAINTEIEHDHSSNYPALFGAYKLNAADGTDSIGWNNPSGSYWAEVVGSFYTA